MNEHADEHQAELVAKKEFDDFTAAVFENQEEIRYGTYSMHLIEFDDGDVSAYLDYSASTFDKNPQIKVSLIKGFESFNRKSHNTSSQSKLSYEHGYLIAVMHEPELLNKVDSVKITFNDKSQDIVPVKDKTAILYLFEPEKKCCAQVDFLSDSGKVLNSRANGIQIFP